MDLLLVVVADTLANRLALRDAGDSLRADLPMKTREILWALGRGQAPAASGIVVI